MLKWVETEVEKGIHTIKYYTSIMNQRGNKEHTLPLFSGLQKKIKKRDIQVINKLSNLPIRSFQIINVIKTPLDETKSQECFWFCNISRSPHLVLGHGTNYKWANHAWQSSYSIGNTHEDTGIARCNVQVVDIKTFYGRRNVIIEYRS